MISAQTIAPGLSAGADQPGSGWGDLEGWAASGAAGRLVTLIRDLIQDPGLSLSADGDRLPLPEREVTLRKIAMRCGVRSPSSAAGWVKSWRAEGLLDPGPPPVVDLAKLRAVAAPVRSDASMTLADPGGGLSQALDVLLSHLRAAHREGSEQAAARIEALSGRLIDSFTARRTARSDARSETVRKIEIQQKELSNFLVSAGSRGDERTNRAVSDPTSATERRATSRAGSINGSGAVAAARDAPREPARDQRTTDETLVLLEPLLEWVRSRSLAPLTDRERLREALTDYDDTQIRKAQSMILRQCRTQGNIRSPIGLLVRLARDGSPDYFDTAPTPTRATPASPYMKRTFEEESLPHGGAVEDPASAPDASPLDEQHKIAAAEAIAKARAVTRPRARPRDRTEPGRLTDNDFADVVSVLSAESTDLVEP